MAVQETGGTKFFRGLLIAALLVAAIVLLIVFWRQVLDGLNALGEYITDHVPGQTAQKVAVIVYLVLAVLFGVLFSKAGHFTAFGVGLGLVPLLWLLFWEGFPPLGLSPTWTSSMGLQHLSPTGVAIWAIIAAVVMAIVFVPLELREKYLKRKHQLADTD
jgi:hypothetical protein